LVVAYDADRSMFASRLWWIFRLCGHSNIRLLDGGWRKWHSEHYPVTSHVPDYPVATFTVRANGTCRTDIDELLRGLGHPGLTLLDVRPAQNFLGVPKWAKRGGHIPGAISLPASTLLNADGTFKSVAELREIMNACGVPSDVRAVTYCGLGLAATAVAFALDMLGFRDVSVFDGSWAEWGSREELPNG